MSRACLSWTREGPNANPHPNPNPYPNPNPKQVLELQTVENEKLLRLLEIEAERTRVHDAVFGVTLLVLLGAWQGLGLGLGP